ncbi:MAG: hypothetical protein O6914_02835 [Chloroflexi bacterium]|nr:hypothetical protein [Chloroflexota bacterium]
MVVGPPSRTFFNRLITFHAMVGDIEVRASEMAIFREASFGPPIQYFVNTLNLTFPSP